MFSSVVSGTNYGLKSYLINVEVDFSQGLPCMVMVGSLGSEVRESAERVRIALKNMGISIPAMHIAINLSPADIRKSGTGFDLPIALAILANMRKIPQDALENTLILGEVGLNGEIKKIAGVMPIVFEASKAGIERCIVSLENVNEASLVKDVEVMGAGNISEVVEMLNSGTITDRTVIFDKSTDITGSNTLTHETGAKDFGDISGQEGLKRGAVIAAAGFHHLLIMGPPGTGKTMIAERMPSIMPPLSYQESMEVTSIYSIAGKLTAEEPIKQKRPFVSLHHTVSPMGLVGGGAVPAPGAISLAHKGVLFLDELPEFRRECIDLLRQPLEQKKINISRSVGTFTFPADIMLVAAMNPCPCGYYPDIQKCSCTPISIKHYLSHISGPILDRIDICLAAERVNIDKLQTDESPLNSENMMKQVKIARAIQSKRYQNTIYNYNSDLDISGIRRYCTASTETMRQVELICSKLQISARGYHRLLKVARTIADLDESDEITMDHFTEAVLYRPMLPALT